MHNETKRTEKELINATRPFATEVRSRSWYYVISTAVVWAALIAVASLWTWTPGRLVVSVLAGLTTVRFFILYHDFLHNAILRGSAVGKAVFYPFGLFVLTAPTVWRQTHNYHHAHTAKIVGSHVGSYPMVTTEMWRSMTFGQRLLYRTARHPLTIALGYVTIFIYGMCISPFIRNPRKNWDSALALGLHVVIQLAVFRYFGAGVWLFALVLPLATAFASGAYLFYAQHNFEGVHIQPRHEWSYAKAALESSSYMKLGPVMRWFTGNIGYHHVHHLNPTIPFYRLPEAMAGIPELQSPHVTTLRLSDIIKCFRLKVWDPASQTMVGYRDAA